jgi:hypothetical protein
VNKCYQPVYACQGEPAHDRQWCKSGNLWVTRERPVRILTAPEAIVPLIDRIRSFLASPQGRRLTDQGRRYASDPRRQQQARGLLARFRRPR